MSRSDKQTNSSGGYSLWDVAALTGVLLTWALFALMMMFNPPGSESSENHPPDNQIVTAATLLVTAQQESWSEAGKYAAGPIALQMSNPDVGEALVNSQIEYELLENTGPAILFQVQASSSSGDKPKQAVRILLNRGVVSSVFCQQLEEQCPSADSLSAGRLG